MPFFSVDKTANGYVGAIGFDSLDYMNQYFALADEYKAANPGVPCYSIEAYTSYIGWKEDLDTLQVGDDVELIYGEVNKTAYNWSALFKVDTSENPGFF